MNAYRKSPAYLESPGLGCFISQKIHVKVEEWVVTTAKSSFSNLFMYHTFTFNGRKENGTFLLKQNTQMRKRTRWINKRTLMEACTFFTSKKRKILWMKVMSWKKIYISYIYIHSLVQIYSDWYLLLPITPLQALKNPRQTLAF